jgi:phosphatidylinositol alpha-mannosyltransferase
MHVGIVCPYSLAVPGGVQAHVLDLARALRDLGHRVDVLAPAGEKAPPADSVTSSGRAVAIRYNGSVARLAFGPLAYARTRRWLHDHAFDVLHLHEPAAPSLSLLALSLAEGPIVATFHAATARSHALSTFSRVLQPQLEKVTGRIAVSPLARRVQVEHLGGDAVEIPNGVDVARFAAAAPLPGYPRRGGTIGFVGRFDEPRKGMRVLAEAMRMLAAQRPDLRLLVVGHGDGATLRRALGSRVDVLGGVDEATKVQALRSVDVLCVPGTAGESFGMVLTEAMAAGAPVVASDLPAFRRVLDGGAAGVLVPVGDPAALALALGNVLDDPGRRAALAAAGRTHVAPLDWPVVAGQVLRVYETALAAVAR